MDDSCWLSSARIHMYITLVNYYMEVNDVNCGMLYKNFK